MSLNWIDVNYLSFNTLLLLERVQLSWFPGWLPENETAIALQANPTVEWYLRHKCPEIISWIDQILTSSKSVPAPDPELIRRAEIKVLECINDLVVYAVDPGIYDAQPFLGWDSNELRMLTDFSGKLVIDIGSGTGRLAFVAAEKAYAVFAVELVSNLRCYIKQKAKALNINNVFPVDGLITDLPFPDGFADITMGGHVFGDNPPAEYAEMRRVTKSGGMIILCPGSSHSETTAHEYLVSNGFHWSRFEEPVDGMKRKYWKEIKK
jgi:SAM-dependent methyltransferase